MSFVEVRLDFLSEERMIAPESKLLTILPVSDNRTVLSIPQRIRIGFFIFRSIPFQKSEPFATLMFAVPMFRATCFFSGRFCFVRLYSLLFIGIVATLIIYFSRHYVVSNCYEAVLLRRVRYALSIGFFGLVQRLLEEAFVLFFDHFINKQSSFIVALDCGPKFNERFNLIKLLCRQKGD